MRQAALRVSTAIVAVLTMMALVGVATMVRAESPHGQARVVTLKVPDMFCGGCEAAVKMTVRKVAGVTAISTDSDKRIARVTYDVSKTSPEAIAAAITKGSGFKVEIPKAAVK